MSADQQIPLVLAHRAVLMLKEIKDKVAIG
jgi:hypothetical protein